MAFPKISLIILFLLFILLFQKMSLPVIQKFGISKDKTYLLSDIDSLRIRVKSAGWNNDLLKQYTRYLKNSEIDFDKELKELEFFPYSFERTYLISLIYKKQKKFKEMYDSLYSQFEPAAKESFNENAKINFYHYYEELVFAAAAINMLSALESKIPELKKQNPFYADYLISLIYYSRGEYKNSLDKLIGWYKKGNSDFSLMYQLSYNYRNLGNYDEAMKILSGIGKDREIDDWEKAKILTAEGSLYYLSGKNTDALKLYNEGYKLSERIKDFQEETRALVNLGIISDVQGNTDNSRNNFFNAIKIAVRINDIDAEALAYSELGVSYSFTNELIKAKANYDRSYKLYTDTGNELRLSLVSNNIGKIYMQMFDYESALKYFQKGIDFAGDNKRAMIKNLMSMADIYTNLSNYSKAIRLYNKALEMSKQIKEVSLDAQISYGLGALYYGLDKFQIALDDFKESYQLNNQSDVYFSAQILNQIAVVYTGMDSLKKAEISFNKAINLSKENKDSYSEVSSCINLSALYLKENDLKSAEQTLNMSRQILSDNSSKYLSSQFYLIKGRIFKEKKMIKDAQSAFMKAVSLSSSLNEFDTQIEAYYRLAKLFEEDNFKEPAESYYKSAINLIEDVSKPLFGNDQVQISYYSSKEEIYNSFAEFYLKQGEYVKAFELIDRSRSRNTIQNLVNLKLQSLIKNDSLLDKIYDYEWIFHSNIYSVDEINKAKAEFSLLKEDLIKKNPSVKKYLTGEPKFSLAEIQNSLGDRENFLSIYTAVNRTYLFLINKSNFYHFEINITPKLLRGMIKDISPYFNYSPSAPGNFYNQDLFAFNAKAAYNLFELLLKPAFDRINNGEKIIISASPELLTLPFEFLISKYDDNGSSYDYNDKDFLVINYDISYSPSAAVFIQQNQKPDFKNEKVLLVGNPLINNKIKGYAERRGLLENQSSLPREVPFLPLKYSGEEVKDIGNIIDVNKILTDKNATETNFKKDAGQNGIIHLSTHSFLFNKQPVIFFSNYYDPENDGFLELGEIVQMKLHSDLVVLSSCNSGLGVIDESEGILGMTKAFFEAGAKSVVVSLWTVNDKYTAKFMALFYQNLGKGLDKSEALRQAKIEFIKKYSANPYYWAAFVLSGNVSKLNIKTKIDVLPYVAEALLIIMIIMIIIYFGRRNRIRTQN